MAPNVFSLAQAKVNPLLHPFVVYDPSVSGRPPRTDEPMLGFVMYQVMEGVGFITRLMIGAEHQREGYGRATLHEVVRRLKATPEVDFIGVSITKGNEHAERLYRELGFVDAEKQDERELYLRLDWSPG